MKNILQKNRILLQASTSKVDTKQHLAPKRYFLPHLPMSFLIVLSTGSLNMSFKGIISVFIIHRDTLCICNRKLWQINITPKVLYAFSLHVLLCTFEPIYFYRSADMSDPYKGKKKKIEVRLKLVHNKMMSCANFSSICNFI